MDAVPYEEVEQQFKGYESSQTDNRKRGETGIDFFIADNMWNGDVVSSRESRNQESLTFNNCIKHLRRMYTQLKEIEFSLNLIPLNDEVTNNVTESRAFRLILNSILLSDEVMNKLDGVGRKCLDYGQSFVEVNFGFENNFTRNREPRLKLHKDPSIAFWDKNATHDTRIDGKFCGYMQMQTAKELIDAYPKIKDAPWLKPVDNKVYNYWWRVYKDMSFVRLKTGVYKREDMLDAQDKLIIDRGAGNKVIRMTGKVCDIYFERVGANLVLEKPKLFPTDDLPLVYHPGLSFWHPRHGEVTMPYLQYMMGAQKLHNYLLSQAATQAKSSTSDKWLFKNEHVQTLTQRQNAQEINMRDGGFTFGGDTQTIRREQPMQISPQLLELAMMTKQEIDEINGAMIDTQNAQQTVIAAAALDKITHNTEAINAWFIAQHVCFVNQVGKLYRQMIPRLYTEERSVTISKKDGSGQTITINQDAGTGKLINNVKDINNNYHYEIKAGASSTMQQENTVKYLTQAYEIDPALFKDTAHIYFRNLQTKDAGELERIAIARGDEALIKYSQGEISMEDYSKMKAEQMEQELQQQERLAQSNPEVQSAREIAAAQHRKAGADEFNAQTKRMDVLNKAQQAQTEMQLKIEALLSGAGNEIHKRDLEELRIKVQQNQQLIDILKTEQREQELKMKREADLGTDIYATAK